MIGLAKNDAWSQLIRRILRADLWCEHQRRVNAYLEAKFEPGQAKKLATDEMGPVMNTLLGKPIAEKREHFNAEI
jgi:hypothetical protein